MDNNYNNPWEKTDLKNPWGDNQKVKDNRSFIKGVAIGVTVTLTFLVIILVANILIKKDYIETDDHQQMLENAGYNPDGSSKDNNSEKKETELEEAFSKAEYIKKLIDKYFYFEDDIVNLDDGIYAGMVGVLGDPYSVYYNEEAYEAMLESTAGSYCGIGVVVQQDIDTMEISVINPYNGCPGFEAGLRSGDIILGTDEVDFAGMDINEAVSYIRGEEDTKVTIHVLRDEEELSFEVTRKVNKNNA